MIYLNQSMFSIFETQEPFFHPDPVIKHKAFARPKSEKLKLNKGLKRRLGNRR
jgi:hypothetical protein